MTVFLDNFLAKEESRPLKPLHLAKPELALWISLQDFRHHSAENSYEGLKIYSQGQSILLSAGGRVQAGAPLDEVTSPVFESAIAKKKSAHNKNTEHKAEERALSSRHNHVLHHTDTRKSPRTRSTHSRENQLTQKNPLRVIRNVARSNTGARLRFPVSRSAIPSPLARSEPGASRGGRCYCGGASVARGAERARRAVSISGSGAGSGPARRSALLRNSTPSPRAVPLCTPHNGHFPFPCPCGPEGGSRLLNPPCGS